MKNQITLIVVLLISTISITATSQNTANEELIKAQNLVMQGKKAEASAILDKLMETQPDNKQAVQFWLMANMKRSPTGEMDAISQLDSLQNLYPKNTGIMFFKNFILAEYGKTEEALAGFSKLTELQPDTALNWIGKGQMLSALKRHEEAVVAFEKALKLDPNRFDVWGMKAAELAQLKKYDEALAAINKGIELKPDYAGNIYNRACIYCLKGDKTHALEDLGTAFAKMPQLKQHAAKDEDLKSLWEDPEFIILTKNTSGSACSVNVKNYTKKEFQSRIIGKWKAIEVWIHDTNLLGERNFYFTFLPDDSIRIDESERNWHIKGKWNIEMNENIIQWKVPNPDESFNGKYDIVDGHLILSGNGFVGSQENICVKLKKQ